MVGTEMLVGRNRSGQSKRILCGIARQRLGTAKGESWFLWEIPHGDQPGEIPSGRRRPCRIRITLYPSRLPAFCPFRLPQPKRNPMRLLAVCPLSVHATRGDYFLQGRSKPIGEDHLPNGPAIHREQVPNGNPHPPAPARAFAD